MPTITEKHLILVFALFFVMSATFLFWENGREMNPDRDKSWWTLSFADPKNTASLAFTIVNHTEESTFRYQISASRSILHESTIEVRPGATETITPNIIRDLNTRTSITVFTGTKDAEQQEIYR